MAVTTEPRTTESRSADPRYASILGRVGGRISRDTLIYALGMMAVFPFSLIQVAVLTRFLAPSAFGDLSLLLMFAGIATIIMNSGTLHGTFMYVFGAGGDGDGDDDGGLDDMGDEPITVEDAAFSATATVIDKRRALTTGFLLNISVIVVVAAIVYATRSQIAGVLLHDDTAGSLVTWALLSAIASALFRFTHNVLRLERRPWTFSALAFVRPALVVSIAGVLAAEGHGVKGVLIGTTAGTAAIALGSVLSSLRSYALAFDRNHVLPILGRGLPYIPVTMSLFLIHSSDVFFLSRYVPTAQVGIYRVASRLASIPSYFVSAYLMAQIPLDRTMLLVAAYEEDGKRATRTLFLTYYVVAATAIVVVLSIGADLIVQLAAPSYHDAAEFVPLVSASFVAYGSFMVVLRMSVARIGRLRRVILTTVALLLMAGFSMVLIPWLGVYGAPLATICAMLSVIGFIFWLGSRGNDDVQPQLRRMGLTLACGAASWWVGTHLVGDTQPWQALMGLLGLALFPCLLVLTGAVPWTHVRVLRNVARTTFGDPSVRGIEMGIVRLPPRRRSVLEQIARDGQPLSRAAQDERISEHEAGARLVRALRDLGGIGAPTELDGAIGIYLTTDASMSARDAIARRLVASGADPLEIHDLEMALKALRRTRADSWNTPANAFGG